MKKNKFITKIMVAAVSVFWLTSCLGDLDRFPENETTSKNVYSTFEGYKGALAKIYAAYTLSGNQGPAGKPDVVGLDEGQNADFLRCWFNHQEMPTDEAHCRWNDPGIPQLNNINFASDPSNSRFTIGLYSKCILQIMYANEFLRNSSDNGDGKNFSGDQVTEVKYFRAEARFLRTFAYWVLMDIFGNPPFITENSTMGELPLQIKRADLFNYLESELRDLTDNNLLKAARANEYGRVDMAAGNALLARLYLNAEVYTGTPRWNDALAYAKKVIDAGYSLKSNYEHLFLADNNLNNSEVILSINYDGSKTRLFGGTTFLINCTSNGVYEDTYRNKIIDFGIEKNNNWGGYRVRKQFSEKFSVGDKRFLFVGENISLGSDPNTYENGLATYKYRNITSASTVGNPIYGSDPTQEFADNDFPLFRLAEMYLIYAESVVRGGGGSKGEAAGYINQLRTRAGVSTIGESELTANFVLDERARELYWECFRRTDLIRFGQFTTADYLWEWKGGIQAGRAVDSHFNIYPIPDSDKNANVNLVQNPGYGN
jgi:hypothetical protein